MNREQALAKIKKCLALAKSSNPHEAAAALRQAQKLMAAFGVTETDVSLADVMEAAAPARLNTFTPWETNLAHMIAEAFGCEHFSKNSRHLTRSLCLVKKREYIFVGVGAAPQVASYAYDVLSRQCARDRLAHIRKQPKNCKPITKTSRGDQFALGWVYGVRELVESFAGTERDQQLIEQYMAERHPDLQTARVNDRAKGRNVSHNDTWQGHLAGQKAQLNRGVGGSEQRGLLT
jgi:hypothetical protein